MLVFLNRQRRMVLIVFEFFEFFEFFVVRSMASWHVLCCLTHCLMADSIVGLVQYNIDRDQKKPVSTIFIRGNEITQKMCACSLISSNTLSDTEQTDLHNKNIALWVDLLLPWVNCCFCREQFAFAVSDLLQCRERITFPVSDLLLPWELTHSENIHVNTRAKGNPVKAVREG